MWGICPEVGFAGLQQQFPLCDIFVIAKIDPKEICRFNLLWHFTFLLFYRNSRAVDMWIAPQCPQHLVTAVITLQVIRRENKHSYLRRILHRIHLPDDAKPSFESLMVNIDFRATCSQTGD